MASIHESSRVTCRSVPTVEQIEPAVADRRHRQPALGHQRGDDSGAHTRQGGVDPSRLDQLQVRRVDGHPQAIAGIEIADIEAGEPGRTVRPSGGSRSELVEDLDDGVGGELRRDFPADMAAHPVGDQVKLQPPSIR